MRLPIVDCRSLIQFCRAFDQHQHKTKTKPKNKKQPTSTSYDAIKNNCDTSSSSPFASLDVLILILVLTSLGYLISPYINIVYNIYTLHILPYLSVVMVYDVVYDAPIAYVIGAVSAFSGVIGTIIVYEFYEAKSRKCGRKECKGLRKAVEFDIQLESEECVKYEFLGSKRWVNFDVVPLELGQGGGCKEELEAELRKMAPVNGRTVLIFREKCGCPKGRLEVWGAKRVRRVKK